MDTGINLANSLGAGIDRLFEYLPQLLGALVLVIVGYFVALLLQFIVRKALNRLRLDKSLHRSPAGNVLSRIIDSPTRFLSKVLFWLVFLGFISLAVSVLNVPALNQFVGAIYGYVPNVIAALVIFLVASAVSGAAVAFTGRVMGKTPTARVVSTVVPSIVMSIAVFMILSELRIAQDIVNITYTALIGAVALGSALAFGLGGRDVAARLLEQAYIAGQNSVDNVKGDVERVARNAKQDAKRVADKTK